MTSKPLSLETRSIHPQRVPLQAGNEPLVSPIHQSVKYTPKNVAHLKEILTNRHSGFLYSRVMNPSVRELEILLAELQGGEDAICLGSGVAALATTMIGLIQANDHVVMFRESYKPTRYLQIQILSKMNVRTTILGMDDTSALASVFQQDPPKVLLVESPTNPLVRVPDLSRLAAQCRQAGTLLILDNTFAGFSHHGELPIDIYIHSLTKHASGHSDAMGGVIIAKQALIDILAPVAITLGATLDPHAAWLISRGMKTYSLRTKAASVNALTIAQWLNGRRGITNLRYPGLATHPDHAVWLRQMKGDGGTVLSFDIDGCEELAEQFIDSLKIFSLTPSMGCVESLVTPCLCLFADDLTPEDAKRAGIGASTIRLAIGIEDAQ
ncbi:MAG: PLP-dependent aspartate aminotransferase family protein, partial [Proteobacteria bacterium]|nr:PLP-dependent aspartate aminotransferase family protein [Pseudomonadota bacterium]